MVGRDEVVAAVEQVTIVTSDPDRAERVLLSRDPELTYAAELGTLLGIPWAVAGGRPG